MKNQMSSVSLNKILKRIGSKNQIGVMIEIFKDIDVYGKPLNDEEIEEIMNCHKCNNQKNLFTNINKYCQPLSEEEILNCMMSY